MPFKLSKEQVAQRDKLIAALNEKHEELDKAILNYNKELADMGGPVEAARAGYNEIIAQARAFCDDIVTKARAEFDEKTQRWQDSDKGQAAQSWLAEWEDILMEDLEIEWPVAIDIEAPLLAEDLEGLPTEIEE